MKTDVAKKASKIRNPPRRKIIYVDDAYFNLVSMKDRLKPYYEIFPVQSADVLFETLEKVEPDLILLDINMPGADGFDIIKGLKATPRFSNIPVIFLTGMKDRETVTTGLELGGVDFVFKPYYDEDLIDSIESQFDEEKQQKSKPIILAVDDDPSILRSINQILHDEYSVYTLPKPEAIEETLKIVKPDLFLLDLHMPVVSGADLVRIIREEEEFEHTPIIFLTSDATSDSLKTAISLGANDYVIKPIDEKALKARLEKHLKNFNKRMLIRSLLQKK